MARKKRGLGRNLLFALGILVLASLFVNVGIELFTESPEYPNVPCYKDDAPREPGVAYPAVCDQEYQDAMDAYEDARASHGLKVFLISLITGVLMLAGGLLISNKAVSWGLMAAGVLQLVIGTTRYWSYMDDWLRFGAVGAGLAVLVFLALRFTERD